MSEKRPRRRTLRYVQIGLMYLGANVWPCAEVYYALRAANAEDAARREAKKDQVTPYEDLSKRERRLLMDLEQRLNHQGDQVPSPRHPTD